MKHIESIQPEYAAFELDRIGREETDATASAALTALLHNVTGCDIPQTDTTPQSDVEELVPLAVSILRRHWTTPLTALGDGTTPMSLADLMRRLIGDRVQGNEALGILPANDNIPAAVSALRQRDMSSGLTRTLTDGTIMPMPDGLSLAQLLCSGLADNITELIDDNIGWVMSKKLPWSTFANVSKVVLNCVDHTVDIVNVALPDVELPHLKTSKNNMHIITGATMEVLTLPALEEVNGWIGYGSQGDGKISHCQNLVELNLPSLHSSAEGTQHGAQSNIVASCPKLEVLNMPNLQYIYNAYLVVDCPMLRKVVFGHLKTNFVSAYNVYTNNFVNSNANLLHLEFESVEASCNLSWWNPTDKGSLFLSNFRLYIADRLSGDGSGKTLTLSQEVRDAIQQDPEIVSIITSKGWTISPVPTQQ